MAPAHSPAKQPRGFLRWAYRLPVALYQVRLGWLLGHRFPPLAHLGRKTGKIRYTVLEVVRYDPDTRESAVLSAYGARADWYRNILAHPAIEMRTGESRYPPQFRTLDAEERFQALRTYERRHRCCVSHRDALSRLPLRWHRNGAARSGG